MNVVAISKGMVMKAIDSDGKSTIRSLARIAAVVVASFCMMSVFAQDESDVSSMAGHKANEEGTKLYKAKDYEAAVPYLQLAAEWGFKDAQVRLGQIYFKGLGSVERNPLRGLAWLGTAASKPSSASYSGIYERALAQVPEENHAAVERAVASFTQRYGSGEAAVTCRMKAPLGSNLAQLSCDYDSKYAYTKPMQSAWDEHASSAFAL